MSVGKSNPSLLVSPPRVSMEEHTDQGHHGKKRSMVDDDDDNFEDLVGQICSKLTNLNTVDKQQHIAAFIEVLECTSHEASFFLESSSWNISTAVSLFLEEQQYSKRRATDVLRSTLRDEVTSLPVPPSFGQIDGPCFDTKPVHIEGLPDNWSASVSPHSGRVVFFHAPSLSRQYMVPPGFAPLTGDHSCGMEESNDAEDVDDMPRLENAFDAEGSSAGGGEDGSDVAVDGGEQLEDGTEDDQADS